MPAVHSPSHRIASLGAAFALWVAVLSSSGVAMAEQPGKLKPDVERGERIWLENCWQCHGKRALGDGPLAQAGPVVAPPLAGRVPEDREPWITAIHRGKETMPAFGPVFDRHDTRRVLVWLEALDPETGDGPSIEKKKADKADKADKTDKTDKTDKAGARSTPPVEE